MAAALIVMGTVTTEFSVTVETLRKIKVISHVNHKTLWKTSKSLSHIVPLVYYAKKHT